MQPTEFDVELKELETRMERLRALYEQYFMGIERIEPSVPRKDVERRVYQLRRVQLRNTAKRFKLQTLIQRFNTLQQHWGKICRQMENGTYTRHLARAERRFGATAVQKTRRGLKAESEPPLEDTAQASAEKTAASVGDMIAKELNAAPAADADVDHAFASLDALKAPSRTLAENKNSKGGPRPPSPTKLGQPPDRGDAQNRVPPKLKPSAPRQTNQPAPASRQAVASPPPRRTKPKAPPAAAAVAQKSQSNTAGLSDARVRSLYGELLQTKKKLNQSSKLSEAALAKSLRASEAKLRQKHGGRDVDFKVAVKDGKVIVKPVLK